MAAPATLADQLQIKIADVELVHLAAVGALPGTEVTFAAARNGTGTGRLRVDSAGLISWRAPGSSVFGPGVAGGDGEYLLYDGVNRDQWIRLYIWNTYLPTLPQEADVRLDDVYNQAGGDDVTAVDAAAGDAEVQTITLENQSTFALSGVKVWIEGNAAAGWRDWWCWIFRWPQRANTATIELSDDNATWVRPASESAALALADIPVDGTVTLYVRRTITAGMSAAARAAVDWRLSFEGI